METQELFGTNRNVSRLILFSNTTGLPSNNTRGALSIRTKGKEPPPQKWSPDERWMLNRQWLLFPLAFKAKPFQLFYVTVSMSEPMCVTAERLTMAPLGGDTQPHGFNSKISGFTQPVFGHALWHHKRLQERGQIVTDEKMSRTKVSFILNGRLTQDVKIYIITLHSFTWVNGSWFWNS